MSQPPLEPPLDPDVAGRIDSRERAVIVVALAVAALMSLAFITHGEFDADESQHLHVAWEWTQGHVQYRDLFDNHAPLFHLLMAPAVAAFKERADIIVMMRLVNFAVYVLALAAVYLLSRRFFTRAVALWTVAILSVYPAYFEHGLQFRPACLWLALWLLGLWVLLGRPLGWKRSMSAGFLFGAAACASIKTPVLFASVIGAGLLLPLVSRRVRGHYTLPNARRIAAPLVAGFVLLPGATAVLLGMLGAWREFIYCTVEHNYVPGYGRWGHPGQLLLLPVVLAAAMFGARLTDRFAARRGLDAGLAFLVLSTGVFMMGLLLLPVILPQTTIPLDAFVAVLAVGLIGTALREAHLARWLPSNAALLIAVGVFSVGVTATLFDTKPWRDETTNSKRFLADLLRLTGPDDFVMDTMGEAVFRRRPFYFVLEQITRERMRRGIISDDIAERLVQTRTLVCGGRFGRFPPDAQQFLKDNYLWTGTLGVAGRIISNDPVASGEETPFEIAIPAEYEILSGAGEGRGVLDGEVYSGPRFLDAGPHVWTSSVGHLRLVAVWSRARERGCMPTVLSEP